MRLTSGPAGSLGLRLLAKHFLVPLAKVAVTRITHPPEVALRAVAAPAVGVVPMTFERMREQQVFVIGAGLEDEVLFAADTTMGELLVALGASKPSNRRERAAVGTAHDELQVAVAYLCHGVSSLAYVYSLLALLPFRARLLWLRRLAGCHSNVFSQLRFSVSTAHKNTRNRS